MISACGAVLHGEAVGSTNAALVACHLLLTSAMLPAPGTISQAVQPAVHDVTDVTCAQSWFNNPLTTSLTADIYKV